jgi:peptide/nickel transport system ATP-binding protein
LINVPAGCAFHPRCAFADLTRGRSSGEVPELLDAGRRHLVRCHIGIEQRRRLFAEQIAPRL